MLQLNFLNQYFTKYKLGLAEILQASIYHSNASLHQKSAKPTSQISRKMQIGCRWWWSFSQKPCNQFFFLKLGDYVPLTTMFLHVENQIHLMYSSWDKDKMVVGDDGHFLKNHALDWAETYQSCSSWYNALLVQK